MPTPPDEPGDHEVVPLPRPTALGEALSPSLLTPRLVNLLKNVGVRTLDQLLACSWVEVRAIPGLGLFMERELMHALRAEGLHLRDHQDQAVPREVEPGDLVAEIGQCISSCPAEPKQVFDCKGSSIMHHPYDATRRFCGEPDLNSDMTGFAQSVRSLELDMTNYGMHLHYEVVAAVIDLAARHSEIENAPCPEARGDFCDEFVFQNLLPRRGEVRKCGYKVLRCWFHWIAIKPPASAARSAESRR